MPPALRPVAAQFRLHHRLLLNCLDGMDDAAAVRRPPGGGNNAAFLVIHLTDARYFVLRLLGSEADNPYAHLEDVRGVDDMQSFPSLEELRAHWQRAGEELDRALDAAAAEQLGAKPPQEFPVEDPTLAGALAFLAHHEAYHIGQISLLRRQWGLGAMSYA